MRVTIQERIAEVLRREIRTGLGIENGEYFPSELFDKAAAAVAAELALTEETRTLTDGWVQPTRNAAYYAQGLTPPPAVIEQQHRWVSEWVGEQP